MPARSSAQKPDFPPVTLSGGWAGEWAGTAPGKSVARKWFSAAQQPQGRPAAPFGRQLAAAAQDKLRDAIFDRISEEVARPDGRAHK